MIYPFGPWQPDRPARLNDATVRTADGCYPMADGYRPVGQWTESFSALPATSKGGATFTSPTGTAVIVSGTSTSLYRAFGSGWQSIGSGYSIQGDKRWRYAQFGGLAIATNGADPMQKIDLTTMTVSALGGNPPVCESLAVVKDFLVATVADGEAMKIAWSAINNAEGWSYGLDQSDFQRLPSGGRVNGILSGEYGVILQRNRICVMDYVGGNVIFDINEVSSAIGCVTPHSVAQWGRLGFFLSDDGFMMWDGSQPVPIGQEEVDRTFTTQYDNSDWASMSTAVDPFNDCVIWSMADKQWGYNWLLKRWFTIPYAGPIVFAGVTKGISIDETDPDVGVSDDNIDGSGLLPLDDAKFRGGAPQFYIFASNNKLGTFDGAPMVATIKTNDIEIFQGRRADLRAIRFESDIVGNVTLTVGQKQRLGDTPDLDVYTSTVTSGDMPIRTSGRYSSFEFVTATGATWTYMRGFEPTGQAGAGR
jgi:hypothetical protein